MNPFPAATERSTPRGGVAVRSCGLGHRAIVLAFVLLLGALLSPAQAPTQSDVEAAYLFNFARFMHAPPRAADAFTIGVAGRPRLVASLQALTANEQIGGKPLRVLRVQSVEDARRSDILFLDEDEGLSVSRLLDAVAASDVLTVSDDANFLARGGMIQFAMVGSRVRFSVNLAAVRRSKIQLSSELLKVALSVEAAHASAEVRP